MNLKIFFICLFISYSLAIGEFLDARHLQSPQVIANLFQFGTKTRDNDAHALNAIIVTHLIDDDDCDCECDY